MVAHGIVTCVAKMEKIVVLLARTVTAGDLGPRNKHLVKARGFGVLSVATTVLNQTLITEEVMKSLCAAIAEKRLMRPASSAGKLGSGELTRAYLLYIDQGRFFKG